MTFYSYIYNAKDYSLYPEDTYYPFLIGLANEYFEFDLSLSLYKENKGEKSEVKNELGDMLWYLALLTNRIEVLRQERFERHKFPDRFFELDLCKYEHDSWNMREYLNRLFNILKKEIRGDYDLNKKIKDIYAYIDAIISCISTYALYCGYSINEVAIDNLEKLESRKKRGKIRGDGGKR